VLEETTMKRTERKRTRASRHRGDEVVGIFPWQSPNFLTTVSRTQRLKGRKDGSKKRVHAKRRAPGGTPKQHKHTQTKTPVQLHTRKKERRTKGCVKGRRLKGQHPKSGQKRKKKIRGLRGGSQKNERANQMRRRNR